MKEKGMSSDEAYIKLKEQGYNEIVDKSKHSVIWLFIRQVRRNFVIYLLLFAMLLSFFVGKSVTGYSLIVVIIIVVTTGFFQEYKAERAIGALKNLVVPVSIVVRDGREQEISSRELVSGDVILLRSGEKIPADCVILESVDFKVNESILTGESVEVVKKTAGKKVTEENLIFAGTFVVNGRCVAKVVDTGMNTKFGKIAGLISSTEKSLPLQNKVNALAKYMALGGILASILIGIIILLRAQTVNFEVFAGAIVIVISVAVASFPEGFPVVLITTLASGAYRMAQKNAIVNRMSIIETLGETTVICADKTGTITKGEMTVRKLYLDDSPYEVSGTGFEVHGDFIYNGMAINPSKDKVLSMLGKCSVICNDAQTARTGTDSVYSVIGSPTEGALLIMAAKAGIHREDLKFERFEEISFNSERKIMSVLGVLDGKKYVFSKGAPEVLISKCTHILRDDGVFKLNSSEKERIMTAQKRMTNSALRTLAFAYKPVQSLKKDHFEEELIFIGIAGMEDPPREEVKGAIQLCKSAGIRAVMITGDNKDTAVAIAKQVGLFGEVMDGSQLDSFSDAKLKSILGSISIFARVKPEHKLRIVKLLKESGEIVTMTGDGVNDSPALKEAHIGVAMGLGGTDVSRSVADLTLKDDNFATIVDAIKEGRTIFTNIQKFASYQISINIAQVGIILASVLVGMPLPLVAMQILFMNLLSDEITAITIGFNPASLDVMDAKPRKSSSILNKKLFAFISVAGIFMAIVGLLTFYFSYHFFGQPEPVARTTAFVTMIFFGLSNAFNFRSLRTPTYKLPLITNKYLAYAAALSIFGTILVVYTPLGHVFETVALSWEPWVIAFCLSISIIILFDLIKAFKLINFETH